VALPLIPVIGLGFFVTFVVLYGMTHGLQTWLASLLNALAHPRGSFWKVTAMKIAGAVVGAFAYVFRAVGHAVSQAASHSIPRVAHWLTSIAVWVAANATVAGRFAEDTAYGFERLVAHTIPRIVAKAIAVPIHEVQLGLRHAERDLALLRRYARGIDRLVRDSIIPRIRAAERAIEVTIPREIADIRHRERVLARDFRNPSRAFAKRIWKLGWLAVGAGLMVKFLVRKFPHLFCRNVTKLGRSICSPRNNLLVDLLLGEAVALFVLADVCATVKAIEGVADKAAPLLQGLVEGSDDFFDWCGGDLPTAHDPPGYSGGLLPTAHG
jgi:hypothetical protein